MTFAIIGAPNSGKSVLFNFLTGLHQKVSNYPGCTVIQKTGRLKFSKNNYCIDLPGIYSLHHQSKDASIATEHVLRYKEKGIDEFLLVCNCTALQRSLVLALQLKKMKVPVSLILNMQDELLLHGGKLDIAYLKKELKIPIFLLSATRHWNIVELAQHMRQRIENGQNSRVTQNNKKRDPVNTPIPAIPSIGSLEKDIVSISRRAILKLSESHTLSERLDAVLLHPLWGRLILLFLVLLIFQAIFTWATPFMNGISLFFDMLANLALEVMPELWVSQFIANGIINGVGSVLVFLPQIAILTLAIGIMEKTGYMTRATFLVDSLLRKAGLQGKVFIPLLTGHACAIPGIMACRTIGNPLYRFLTIFIVPFTSCSARLPVYTLLITAFIPDQQILGLISIRTSVLFLLYLAGSLVGIAVAGIAKLCYLYLKQPTDMLILDRVSEIPKYRMPTLTSLLLYTWQRIKLFLKRAGTTILGISAIFWILTNTYLPGTEATIEHSLAGIIGRFIHPFFKPLGLDWQSSTAVLIGLTAREIFVSTASVLYLAETGTASLLNSISSHLEFASGIALLVYYIYAPQCLATFAVMLKETRSSLFTVSSFVVMFALAYGLGALAYALL